MEGKTGYWGGYTTVGPGIGRQTASDVDAEERWPECFQDLASWCRQPQDELNTPQALHDEFNFSIDGRGRGDCTWDEMSYPTVVDAQNDLWDTPDPLLPLLSPSLASTNNNNIMEDNKNLNLDTARNSLQKHHMTGGTLNEGLNYGLLTNEDYHPIKSNGNLLLSQSSLGSGEMHTESSSELYNILKSEDKLNPGSDATDSARSAECKQSKETGGSLNVAIKLEQRSFDEENDAFKVPQSTEIAATEKKLRPKLKLNIGATQSAPTTSTYSLDTPDVMKSLTDESTGFDLLSFVDGDFDDPNVLIADPSSLIIASGLDVSVGSQIVANSSAIKCDHDYTEIRVKEALPPFEFNGQCIQEAVTAVQEFKKSVKSEPLSPQKHDAGGDERQKSVKRRPTAESSDDYNYESEVSSTDDDGSVDWSPSKKKRGRGGTTRGRKRGGGGCVQNQKAAVKKQRKYSMDSDGGDSIKSGDPNDRYRELRDRNNEASRKSRLNRKQKEMHMNQLAFELEGQNTYLKNKADSLEKLVRKLRDTLMNIVLKK